jgi:hypothetical protein
MALPIAPPTLARIAREDVQPAQQSISASVITGAARRQDLPLDLEEFGVIIGDLLFEGGGSAAASVEQPEAEQARERRGNGGGGAHQRLNGSLAGGSLIDAMKSRAIASHL